MENFKKNALDIKRRVGKSPEQHPDGRNWDAASIGMHGNVWEWCRDWYTDTLSGGRDPERSQPGDALSRVLRGGCWNYDGGFCRSVYRFKIDPDGRYQYYGFRVAGVRSDS